MMGYPDVRGGFGIPVNPQSPRIPRTRVGSRPESFVQVQKELEQKQFANPKTEAKTQPKMQRTKKTAGPKTTTKSKKQSMGRTTRTAVKMYAGARGLSPTFRSPAPPRPESEDGPGKSIPSGEVPYLDGPRISLPSDRFTGIRELDQLDQLNGDWNGTPSTVRTLFIGHHMQLYPQYGGIYATKNQTGISNLVNATDTQDIVVRDTWAGIYQYYSEKYTANQSFKDDFTVNNFFLYMYDTSRLLAELVCLLQRSAYYQSEQSGYTENPSVEKIANVLNTTTFYPIRNKMARALKRQFISAEIKDEMYMFLQTNRLTPHETGGTIFNTTDNMALLINYLGVASNEAAVQTAVDNYITALDEMCDLVLFGRPVQTSTTSSSIIPKRDINGSTFNLYADDSTESSLTIGTRNAISAILQRVSGENGPYDFVKLNRIEPGSSQSMYDPAFCDRFNNNIAIAAGFYYPPMMHLDGDQRGKANLADSIYYVSERDSNEQDCRTAYHMLSYFAGESPIFYDASRMGNNRRSLFYRGRNLNITTEDLDLTYQTIDTVYEVENTARVPVAENYTTKLWIGSDNQVFYTRHPDGDGSPLYFLTYANILEMFKKKYINNM